MERRRALTIATATVATVAGASAAIAANLGLLSGSSPSPGLSARTPEVPALVASSTAAPSAGTVAPDPEVIVRYEDVYEQVPVAANEATGDAPQPSAAPDDGALDRTGPAAPTTLEVEDDDDLDEPYVEDDSYEDDEDDDEDDEDDEDEDDDEDGEEDEVEEYEGAEDDD